MDSTMEMEIERFVNKTVNNTVNFVDNILTSSLQRTSSVFVVNIELLPTLCAASVLGGCMLLAIEHGSRLVERITKKLFESEKDRFSVTLCSTVGIAALGSLLLKNTNFLTRLTVCSMGFLDFGFKLVEYTSGRLFKSKQNQFLFTMSGTAAVGALTAIGLTRIVRNM